MLPIRFKDMLAEFEYKHGVYTQTHKSFGMCDEASNKNFGICEAFDAYRIESINTIEM